MYDHSVPRIAFLIAALAILAGGLWLLTGSRARRAAAPGLPGIESEPPRNDPDVLAGPAAAEDGAGTERGRDEVAGARKPAGSRAEKRAPALDSDDLHVRVLDQRRRPVVGISLRVERNDDVVGGPGSSAISGADGLAIFGGLRNLLRAPEEGWTRWTIVHDMAFEELPTLLLTSRLLDQDVIESVLPPFGAIEVRASELDGSRAKDVALELALVRREEGRDALAAFDRPSWTREAPEGVAHFPFVELGRDWSASVHRLESDVRSHAEGAGPSGQGQVVELEVVHGSDHPVLALRAVDRAGKPFARVRLALERGRFQWSTQSFAVGTDERGVFTIDSDRGWYFGGDLLVTYTPPEGEPLRGYAQLPHVLEAGLQDGGDVVLEPSGVLVAGYVVDELGNGVADARVAAGSNVDYEDEPVPEPSVEAPELVIRLGRVTIGALEVSTRSSRAGAFELVGRLPGDEFQVWAQVPGMHAEPITAKRGACDLVLVLHPVWTVSGRVRSDPEAPVADLRLLRDGAEAASVASMDPDGCFRMRAVSTGLYDFVVRSGSAELLRLAGLSIASDVDLGDLDVEGRLHHHSITLLGLDTGDWTTLAVLRTEYVWRPVDDLAAGWERGTFDGDRLDVRTPAAAIAVHLAPAGYRRIDLERVSGAVEVRVREPLRVRLLLRTTGTLPRYPYVFDPYLQADGLDTAWAEGSPYWTEENDEVVFRVAVAGRIEVGWHLERRSENMAIGGGVLSDHVVPIDVLDQPGEQVFVVELDGEALSALVAAPPF
jgi:hypothetical protein